MLRSVILRNFKSTWNVTNFVFECATRTRNITVFIATVYFKVDQTIVLLHRNKIIICNCILIVAAVLSYSFFSPPPLTSLPYSTFILLGFNIPTSFHPFIFHFLFFSLTFILYFPYLKIILSPPSPLTPLCQQQQVNNIYLWWY